MNDPHAAAETWLWILALAAAVTIVACLFIGDGMEWLDNRRSKRAAVKRLSSTPPFRNPPPHAMFKSDHWAAADGMHVNRYTRTYEGRINPRAVPDYPPGDTLDRHEASDCHTDCPLHPEFESDLARVARNLDRLGKLGVTVEQCARFADRVRIAHSIAQDRGTEHVCTYDSMAGALKRKCVECGKPQPDPRYPNNGA